MPSVMISCMLRHTHNAHAQTQPVCVFVFVAAGWWFELRLFNSTLETVSLRAVSLGASETSVVCETSQPVMPVIPVLQLLRNFFATSHPPTRIWVARCPLRTSFVPSVLFRAFCSELFFSFRLSCRSFLFSVFLLFRREEGY